MMVHLTVTETDKTLASSMQTRTTVCRIQRMLGWGTTCIRRYRERSELRQLDLRDRQDLGHSRVNTELGKPFWRQ